MLHDPSHLSDQELLLLADGELPSQREATARSHLAACWTCRTRMQEIASTIADFVHLYQQDLHPELPSIEGPAALLKATLSRSGPAQIQRRSLAGIVGVYAALVALFALGIVFATQQWTVVEAASVPRADLTPGAVTQFTRGDACRAENFALTREVPFELQEAVFKEYGIAHPRPRAYEVDYLITPELGGAKNIRNLWPEPYFTTRWNARVKDALERRLHEMVCNGQLDLATAQHDISADWISAYKKYFHTDRPLNP